MLALILSLVVVLPVGAAPNANGWTRVTPANANLGPLNSCGNYGAQLVLVDPDRPSDLYTHFDCQGVWKSIDYGLTWTGPINTGANGATAGDCAGDIAIATGGGGANPPILYESCIRGAGIGFWRSLDGGASWTNFQVTPPNPSFGLQDMYYPDVDPYDPNHLLMDVHEGNGIRESFDGGQTWHAIHLENGMCSAGNCPPLTFSGAEPGQQFIGSGYVKFIDTGSAASTRTTWMWFAETSGGNVGSWRTTNSGTNWTEVACQTRTTQCFEHAHGTLQILNVGNGVILVPGQDRFGGGGVWRSTDAGATWGSSQVSNNAPATAVWQTPTNVYAGYGWACGPNCPIDPHLQFAPQPGTGTWTNIPNPGMVQGPGGAAVTFDGSNYQIVTANWLDGLWRYTEPRASATQ